MGVGLLQIKQLALRYCHAVAEGAVRADGCQLALACWLSPRQSSLLMDLCELTAPGSVLHGNVLPDRLATAG